MESTMIIITRSNLGNLCTWIVELDVVSVAHDSVIVSTYNAKGDRIRTKELMSEKVLEHLLNNEGEVISVVRHS